MTETQLLTLAASLVATLFGLLILILGWLGNKLYDKLGAVFALIGNIQSELSDRINGLDRRLTTVEAKCKFEHDRRI